METLSNAIIVPAQIWNDGAYLLLDVAVKGTILLLIVSGLVIALRNASAAVRHLVWCAGVIGLLVLPTATLIVPKWTVPGADVVTAVLGSYEHSSGGDRHLAPSIATKAPRPPARINEEGRGVPVIAEAPMPARASHTTAEILPVPAAPPAVPEAGTVVSAAAGPASVGLNVDWRTWLPVFWLTGVFACLLWVLGGLVRTWMVARRSRTLRVGPIVSLFVELTEELDLGGRVTLMQSKGPSMPMAWGLSPRILLPVDADDWTDARLRTVLMHELAHVKRRDYLTQQIARFVAAIHWFNPLVWVAVHRMRVERELACDDQVLSTGPKASEYASHLLDIARMANGRSFVPFGGVAMARRSRLSDRLLAVLDDKRRRATVTPRLSAVAWASAACFVLPIAGAGLEATPVESDAGLDAVPEVSVAEAPLPTTDASVETRVPPTPIEALSVPTPAALTTTAARMQQGRCNWSERGEDTSTWMNGEDGDYQVRITTGDCRLDIEIVGEVVFNDAETDVVSISRGGYFEIEEREGRYRRKLVIEPSGNGDLERRWFENGSELEYGGEARAWLSDLVPLMFRRLGLQAEERARRIFARHGVDGVLQEISEIPSDYVARKYYQALLTEGDLSVNQLQSIVRQAGDELESDYELAQLLVEVAENHPADESVMVVYVEAAGSIDSDYEQRRVLDAILSRQDLSQEVADRMLQLAADIESDYELAELLIAMLDRHPIDEVLTREFFDAVHTLESDYEHHRVLKAALHEGAPNQEVLNLALLSAGKLDSDYERAELLLEVAELYPVGEAIPSSYLDAAVALDSDYELGRVLKYLVGHQRLSGDVLAVVLDASLTLDSDYEMSGLLLEILASYELTETEREVFYRALGSMDSDYEMNRILTAIVEQGSLTDDDLRAVFDAATEMDSDYELANLLVMIAQRYTLEGESHSLFLRAANTISSEYERGRVLSALHPRGTIQM